jgi:hypothetical protein
MTNKPTKKYPTKKQRIEKLKKLKAENPFYLHYIKTTDALNEEYYVTKLARQGLVTLREELKNEKPFTLEIEIPSVNGREIRKEKDKSKIVDILKRSIKSDLYANSLGSGVSLIEQFLEEIIRTILIMHPGKLSVDVGSSSKKEAQEEKKIDLKDIIGAKSLDDIYLTIINQRLYKLFYASPTDYFKYFKDIIQIKLDEDLVLTYVEIKATRDLLVHNKGKVNAIYVQKAGTKARATDPRQNIPITEQYYIQSFASFKKIVRDTYECASKEYLKITHKADLYASK